MFYPRLSHDFMFYFKDRQAVHIELMFRIDGNEQMNQVVLKRKISSGNLEADLLCMRYLSHYLYTQKTAMPIDKWQAVKIDFSAHN